jgi:hypothetical protein
MDALNVESWESEPSRVKNLQPLCSLGLEIRGIVDGQHKICGLRPPTST